MECDILCVTYKNAIIIIGLLLFCLKINMRSTINDHDDDEDNNNEEEEVEDQARRWRDTKPNDTYKIEEGANIRTKYLNLLQIIKQEICSAYGAGRIRDHEKVVILSVGFLDLDFCF